MLRSYVGPGEVELNGKVLWVQENTECGMKLIIWYLYFFNDAGIHLIKLRVFFPA